MNQLQKKFFALAVLVTAAQLGACSSSSDCGNSSGGSLTRAVTPYYSIRSQGFNLAREMVGWENLINLCEMDKFYGGFAIAGEYSQSFKSDRICKCLFGNFIATPAGTTTTVSSGPSGCESSCNSGCESDCNACSLNVSGSCVSTRGSADLLADYFGLPTDFSSTISFSPKIKNFVADVEFYLGLDEWAEGLYFRLNLPITWTRWELNFSENVIDAGTNNALAGYYAEGTVDETDLLHSAASFFTGSAPVLNADENTVVFDALTCAKFPATGCNCKGLSKTRLADVEMILGYNFVCDEDYYFGLNVRSEAPTGNRPKGEFLFEPIVGNGHHWTLGGGLTAHAVLWRGEESDSTFSFYLDAAVTHLFKTCQTRSFDLCSAGPLSRYMLAERLQDNVQGLNGLTPNTDGLFACASAAPGAPLTTTVSDFQFAAEFAPVANLTCSNVDVSVSVQGDVAFKFEYANENGFNWDLGYEFWGRACESICRRSNCNGVTLSNWALKGDAFVYGATCTTGTTIVALAATESLATIHAGTNFVNNDCTNSTATTLAETNPNIDNPAFAITVVGTVITQLAENTTGADRIRTSIQPIRLSDSDVNLASNSGISNKIFTNFSYSWVDNEDWTPFLGVGASVEFGPCGSCNDNQGCCPSTSSDSATNFSCCSSSSSDNGTCVRCSLSQWAVWVKGGIVFN